MEGNFTLDGYLTEFFSLDISYLQKQSIFQIWLPDDNCKSFSYDPDQILDDILNKLYQYKDLQDYAPYSPYGILIFDTSVTLSKLGFKVIYYYPRDRPPQVGNVSKLKRIFENPNGKSSNFVVSPIKPKELLPLSKTTSPKPKTNTPLPKTPSPLPKTPSPLPKTPTPLPKTPTPLPKTPTSLFPKTTPKNNYTPLPKSTTSPKLKSKKTFGRVLNGHESPKDIPEVKTISNTDITSVISENTPQHNKENKIPTLKPALVRTNSSWTVSTLKLPKPLSRCNTTRKTEDNSKLPLITRTKNLLV